MEHRARSSPDVRQTTSGRSTAATVTITWVRAVSAVVALLTGTRAVLLLAGSSALELVAPVAFIVLVLCLAWSCWRRSDASLSEPTRS